MSEDVTYHSAICDECGNRTNATTRELATGVTCAECEEVPNWPSTNSDTKDGGAEDR